MGSFSGQCGVSGDVAHRLSGDPKRIGTQAAHRVHKAFAGLSKFNIGLQQGFDGLGHFDGCKRWPQHLARLGWSADVTAIGASQSDLVPLLSVFVDAQNANVAAVVVAAGVDATADVQVNRAQVFELIQVLVTRNDFIGQGQ